MDKREFLDVLRQSLNGEVSSDIIEQNIKYYDQYISSQSSVEEARIIEVLGDPRLIAKTIIETDKAAKSKGRFSSYQDDYSDFNRREAEDTVQNNMNHNHTGFYTNFTWYHKLMLIFVLIIVLSVFIFVGKIIIVFLFTFAVPILLVLLLMALFKKRN